MSRKDWMIAGAACLVLAVTLYFLTRPDAPQTFRRKSGIAEIVSMNRDVRTKSAGEVMWFPGESRQFLDQDDAVFSGENSTAAVRMRDGTVVNLGPNSMITIRDNFGMKFASLESGTFTVKMNGPTSLMINGQVTMLEGQGEVALAVEGKNPIPRVTTLSGTATLQIRGAERESVRRELPGARISTSAPEILDGRHEINHDWRLRDWFQTEDDGGLTRLPRPRPTVAEEMFLSWRDSNPGGLTVENTGESPEYKAVYPNQTNPARLTELFLGLNRARVSRDGSLWSEPYEFKVDASYALNAAEWKTARSWRRLPASGAPAVHRLEWNSVSGASGYVLESASNPDFSGSASKLVEVNNFKLEIAEPGQTFLRVWAFDERQRLSEPSQTLRAVTLAPKPKPEPPRAPAAVEIPVAQMPPPQPPPLPPEPAPVEPAPAETGMTGEISAKVAKVAERLNRLFKRGKLQVEGSTFTMYSTEQNRSGRPAPIAGMVGLRWTKWFGKVGTEIAARLRAFGMNESGGEVQAMSGEVRLYRRKTMVWPQFWFLRKYQAAVMLGMEVYRNENPGEFVSGYEALKSGFVFNIPVANNWETGGEILMGLTGDFSRKYELSGFLNYFWDKRWAIGGGYRVHMFEAQTSSSAPGAIPYREAYGEGYGLLKYHF